ncbi:putative protease YdeA [Pseudovibrio axinellae]|uniref:Putative protease YdeA n=1 Tax=Pseudovibrio axinellae TaxID=989403 RepID=A0A165YTU7_9HYPH|nr:DJ-1/PfpI family protein [Pseudovibrio axinellae]KZL19229.1 putative protease YdeA [Pseudovibrio axinellae]SEQ45069.1 DJ-1/PfpI family protein [Pseudovibrio axinellae]
MSKIAVILTQGFADWEYALIAGTGGPFFNMQVEFFAPEAEELTSQGGLTAIVLRTLDEIKGFQPNVIVVVGGTIWESEKAPDISSLLQSHHEKGVTVSGICGGTLALARAGLLNEVAHTSNNAVYLKQNVQHYTGEQNYCDSAVAISAGNVISAPGIAPVSFSAAVFEAAGLNADALQQFRAMLAAEHTQHTQELMS